MNDMQKILKIKAELSTLWIDEATCEPLTGDKLLDAALDNDTEYRELRQHLIAIQNIVFGQQ